MDFYSLLGVSRNARSSEIKAAFRKIALKYHPDRHAGASAETKADVAKKFKAATEAYETLMNSSKRFKYDGSGRTRGWQSAPNRSYNPSSYNYQGYTAHTPQRGSMSSLFSALARNMTHVDGLFHAGMASIFLVGAIFAGAAGDHLWSKWNRGRLFHHLETGERPLKKTRNVPSPAIPSEPSDPMTPSDAPLDSSERQAGGSSNMKSEEMQTASSSASRQQVNGTHDPGGRLASAKPEAASTARVVSLGDAALPRGGLYKVESPKQQCDLADSSAVDPQLQLDPSQSAEAREPKQAM